LALVFALALAGFSVLFCVDRAGRGIVERAEGLVGMAREGSLEILHMRRHEKNFLLRRDRQYISVVGQRNAAARGILQSIMEGNPESAGQCSRAQELLAAYWTDFQELAATYTELGLTDAPGRLHAFVQQHLSLVEAVRQLGGKDTDIALLDLEAKENSYLLRVEQEAAAAVFEALPVLEGHHKHGLTRGQGDTAPAVSAAIANLEDAVRRHAGQPAARDAALSLIAEAQRIFAGIVAGFDRRKGLEVRLVGTVRALEAEFSGLGEGLRLKKERLTARLGAGQIIVELGTVLAAALLILGIARSIARPLKFIQRYSEQVAAGDLDARVEGEMRGEFALLHQDITRMVETLRDMIRDLRAKEEEAQREAARAEAASRMKSAFLSLVSHELRTPLTSVLGFLKVARRRLSRKLLPAQGQEPASNREDLSKLQGDLGLSIAAAEELAGLVARVIDLTEMESGEVRWDMAPVFLGEVVEEAAAAAAATARDKGLDFAVGMPLDLPPVRGNQERLVRAVEALLCNAVKFTEQGQVAVRAESRDGEVVLAVSDTGPGIPPEMRDAIFQPFHQIEDNLTGKPRGLGLGLALCKLVADAHGGRVWMHSEPGRGSTFFLALPVSVA
jgi:signal transduction histidine kinase